MFTDGGIKVNICVYGAASNNIKECYIKEGEALGAEMAKRGHKLVFGGGSGGLMGAVARGVYSSGNGGILGIVPKFFTAEGTYVDGMLFEHCDKTVFPKTMRERKALLESESDAFIITPGGIGTYDELFEMLTLKNLGRHNKPMAVLNTCGYYDALLKVIEDGIEAGFIKASVKELLFIGDSIDAVLDYIEG